MCIGALQQADADGVVYSLADPVEGACHSAVNLAEARGLPRRLNVVSGILRDDAADLRPDLDPERARLSVPRRVASRPASCALPGAAALC